MKICAYTALHYGLDYFYWAIRSVIDYIDEYYVLYSPVGSHGHAASRPCPETRDQLYSVAQLVAGNKLRWIDGQWAHEGLQRMTIHEVAPDADVILVLDSDEIWPYGDKLPVLIQQALDSGQRCIRLPMVHFWRSFSRAILHDPAYPTRIIVPKIEAGEITLGDKPLCHMGYAQRPEIVQYKLETHGHKGEFRRDCDWFQDKYLNPDAKTDLHPVGSQYWNAEPVNPWDYLPEMMKSHPYVGMEVIK